MIGHDGVREAVSEIRKRIAAAAARAHRRPEEVTLVAVTKTAGIDAIRSAAEAGVTDFGENRAKDLRDKAEVLDPALRWHFVGGIQTNKVAALDRAWLIHGLDRVREAKALQARADRLDRVWDVLIEVNIGGEPQKQGVAPDEVEQVLEGVLAYPRVRPRGLMFMAPQVKNAEDVRALFAQARTLLERFAGLGLTELSMGMSDDFEVAVEEGSTIVRIGRSIFQSPGTVRAAQRSVAEGA
jgi:pyridoxal phosphate enzyme (YggS family)